MNQAAPPKYRTPEALRAYSRGYAAGSKRAAATVRRLRAEIQRLKRAEPEGPKQRTHFTPGGWVAFRTQLPTAADARDGLILLMEGDGKKRTGMWDWIPPTSPCPALTWEANGFLWWRRLAA